MIEIKFASTNRNENTSYNISELDKIKSALIRNTDFVVFYFPSFFISSLPTNSEFLFYFLKKLWLETLMHFLGLDKCLKITVLIPFMYYFLSFERCVKLSS